MRDGDSQRGLTLTEVMVVIVLAAVVMTGLVVFYLNSQTMWMDGSAQAITQRELTLALHEIGQRARRSGIASVSGDMHASLRLDLYPYNPDHVPNADSLFSFWIGPDSLLHSGYPNSSTAEQRDLGPMLQSRLTVFAAHSTSDMVYVDSLGAVSPQGARVRMRTAVALMNR